MDVCNEVIRLSLSLRRSDPETRAQCVNVHQCWMSQIFIFLWFPSDLLVVHSFCGGELAKDVAADKDVEDDGDHKGDTEEGAGGHGARLAAPCTLRIVRRLRFASTAWPRPNNDIVL